MRERLKPFYPLSEAEYVNLWDGATFILDTNVLLHLYRISKPARDDLFDVIESLQERIWIPYHVAYEFLKNRPTVISSQSARYDMVVSHVDELREELFDVSKGFSRMQAGESRGFHGGFQALSVQ